MIKREKNKYTRNLYNEKRNIYRDERRRKKNILREKMLLISINRSLERGAQGKCKKKIFNNRASNCEERATRNETDTSRRCETSIISVSVIVGCTLGSQFGAPFPLPLPSPSLSVLATKSSFTPFIRAREAGRYRSIQARHSTSVEKRERRDKDEFKKRSGTSSSKQTLHNCV